MIRFGAAAACAFARCAARWQGSTPCGAAIVRVLQCVASFGCVCKVAITIALSCSAVISFGRPRSGRSTRMPAMPSPSHRFGHSRSVGTDVEFLRAISRFVQPVEASRMILIRGTMLRGVLRRSSTEVSHMEPFSASPKSRADLKERKPTSELVL
jgi:hypothetical protein